MEERGKRRDGSRRGGEDRGGVRSGEGKWKGRENMLGEERREYTVGIVSLFLVIGQLE